jgi:putative ABC transport system permease protein
VLSRFLQTVSLGIKSLLLHKLRSALAVLGILIGVTAVIWLVGMGQGVSQQAQEQIKELGATNIIVQTVKPPQTSDVMSGSMFSEYGLLREDFDRIKGTIPGLTQAVPVRVISKEARYDTETADVRLVGCTPAYMELNHLTIDRGRYIEDRDCEEMENVCVLAAETARKLFPYKNPIGEPVLIERDFFTVIGLTENRTASAAIGGSLQALDYNMDVYIPIDTFRWRFGDMIMTAKSGSREGEIVELNQITLSVASLDEVDETADIVKTLLEKYHKVKDYEVTVPKELLAQAEVLEMMFNLLLVLIAGIALLVGGIGIMNIMLATVTERTREIGIRRALGAKRRDIIQQFLSETVVLSGTGGVLGVVLGFLCGPAVSATRWTLQKVAAEQMANVPPNILNVDPILVPWSIGVAFMIAVVVGIVFGIYPAVRAAYMDPIEALRHE